MSTALTVLSNKLAESYHLSDGQEVMTVLKATVFKSQMTEAQMATLLMVANQYGLNPLTKEIYAFPDKNNGIVPVVGVDGWVRIINSHPQFNGMAFKEDAESCTCIIYRKDRDHPIAITEYRSECARNTPGPWQSHPKRMLRHKAMIQCARMAFGFSGIYDPDEAEQVIEATSNSPSSPGAATVIDAETGEMLKASAAPAVTLNLMVALYEIAHCPEASMLDKLWADFGNQAAALKDRQAWKALRNAVAQRHSELAAASASVQGGAHE